jgi:hypothetical protein
MTDDDQSETVRRYGGLGVELLPFIAALALLLAVNLL